MNDPNLLIPAIIAFSLLIVGLVVTVREFYTEKNISEAPIDHKVRVVRPSPDQVVPGESAR